MYYFCIGNSADGDKVIHGKTHNIRGIEPLYIVRKLCLWFKMYSGNCFFTFEAKNGHTKSGINKLSIINYPLPIFPILIHTNPRYIYSKSYKEAICQPTTEMPATFQKPKNGKTKLVLKKYTK